MSREQVFMLKLQMGIDPATRIEPNMLRAMWRQLELETVEATRRHPHQATNQNR